MCSPPDNALPPGQMHTGARPFLAQVATSGGSQEGRDMSHPEFERMS